MVFTYQNINERQKIFLKIPEAPEQESLTFNLFKNGKLVEGVAEYVSSTLDYYIVLLDTSNLSGEYTYEVRGP